MRLFIAVDLDEELKTRLDELSAAIERQLPYARRTRRENYHLTLAFIGESTRAGELMTLLGGFDAPAFELRFSKLGRFKRAGGDVLWLGAEPCPPLLTLQKRLAEALRAQGFVIEQRPFRPHLTLLREAAAQGFDERAYGASLPAFTQTVRGVSLFCSERQAGRLVYTELYRRALGAAHV
ncbi:MAG: RNA 2',3'-cyclic phosphodiesterase [Bacillota bacterium]|nr:RNA 2',3'-cyclic phosphodiesterase [Bacillota bacterium]